MQFLNPKSKIIVDSQFPQDVILYIWSSHVSYWESIKKCLFYFPRTHGRLTDYLKSLKLQTILWLIAFTVLFNLSAYWLSQLISFHLLSNALWVRMIYMLQHGLNEACRKHWCSYHTTISDRNHHVTESSFHLSSSTCEGVFSF